jgi:CRISPR system Cascade subunit CasD
MEFQMKYISMIFDGMQSWSVDGKFRKRLTENIPTKSGVIGIILNAMGSERGDDSLLPLFQKIPVDTFLLKGGLLEKDYQVANSPNNVNPVLKASGAKHGDPVLVEKEYYSSAISGAILEIEDGELCENICNYLKSPERILFLGRKNHMPNKEIFVGIFDDYEGAVDSLIESVEKDPFYPKMVEDSIFARQDIIAERKIDEADLFNSSVKSVRDVPISFSASERKYSERFVLDSFMNIRKESNIIT